MSSWYHLSNVISFHDEDVNATCLKVIPKVVVRDHQQDLTGVTFLSVELHKHIGVRAAPRDTARLHSNVIVNI